MSVPPSNLPSTTFNPTPPPVPVAKPRRRASVPAVTVAEGDDVVDTRSPWELHGWAASLGIHFVLLLILGLWYFAPPATKVKSFDTRLAGTEFGSDDGMSSTGGLDTPLPPPEAMAPSPELTPAKLQASDSHPDRRGLLEAAHVTAQGVEDSGGSRLAAAATQGAGR